LVTVRAGAEFRHKEEESGSHVTRREEDGGRKVSC
jgi:hypothetical protein